MDTPTNYSACVRTRIEVLNISRDKIFVVNVQPAKTAKFFNLENFRLYGILQYYLYIHNLLNQYSITLYSQMTTETEHKKVTI